MTNKEANIAALLCEVLAEGNILSQESAAGKRKTLFFDCRSMYEPQSKEHREHCGTHPGIFNHLCTSSDALAQHVMELTRNVHALHWAVTALTLVVFDVKGRHAAMAVGKVFAEICLRAEDLTLSSITYLSQESDVDCSMCPLCSFWSRASGPRNDLITKICNKYASSLWPGRPQ